MDPGSSPAFGDVDRRAEARTRSSQGRFRAVLGYVGGPVFAGLVAGLLVGGVGGRLAMLLLRLTSSDALRGVQTDDGFTIGEFTGATVFFVAVMGILGAAGGVFYRVVRRWLPRAGRPLLAGVLFAALGGSVVVEPEGIDFVLVDPLWLAVVLFVALPFAYGATMARLAEALIARPDRLAGARQMSTVVLVPALFAPPALLAVGLSVASYFVDESPRWRVRVDGPVVTWTVRTLLLVGVLVAAGVLAGNVREIL